MTLDRAKEIVNDVRGRLERDFDAAATYKPNKADWLDGKWAHLNTAPTLEERRGDTALPLDKLECLGNAIVNIPEGFNIHPRLKRIIGARRKMVETGNNIDWSMGEALAFGSLADEGYLVRLSGQDVQRGTFSQRHAHLIDQKTERHYIPLMNISKNQGRFVAHNSPLSEAAILGFEYGYSLVEPDALVCWEAQFGDFSNGAQVIIDQFISSAERKWLRMSGIVMLLPHGYEGQGPEHSSARLERYLQLCGEDNIQVCMPSTPASYFHLLRRQLHRSFRKPLIIMTPKSLLRNKLCVSSVSDMGPGTSFKRVIPDMDEGVSGSRVKRVILCSGKVYYDLYEERRSRDIKNIALVRLEQIYPFPNISLRAELQKYSGAEVVWCQEEPQNMGAWTFVDRRIEALLIDLGGEVTRPRYIGRSEAASPATGSSKAHVEQQKKLVDEALFSV
jgi:2-oxoglutarate dehydrogenase E1 component